MCLKNEQVKVHKETRGHFYEDAEKKIETLVAFGAFVKRMLKKRACN